MNKRQRIEAALSGGAADRPPVSAWYHFGLQYGGGERLADASLGFLHAYDWDFLKVMNDYSFPLPDGCEVVQSKNEWEKLGRPPATPMWPEQLRALQLIRQNAGKDVPILETIFSPWTVARRAAGLTSLLGACQETPDLVLGAMERISKCIARHIAELQRLGVDGIFLSLGAASKGVLSREEYARFCRPFDLQVLDAARNLWFNVLHVHGTDLHFDLTLDYPAQAWNWSDQQTRPSLAEARSMTGRCVMGGIDEQSFSRSFVPHIRGQVRKAAQETGCKSLIITPGCSVPADTPYRNLAALSASVQSIAGNSPE